MIYNLKSAAKNFIIYVKALLMALIVSPKNYMTLFIVIAIRMLVYVSMKKVELIIYKKIYIKQIAFGIQ